MKQRRAWALEPDVAPLICENLLSWQPFGRKAAAVLPARDIPLVGVIFPERGG